MSAPCRASCVTTRLHYRLVINSDCRDLPWRHANRKPKPLPNAVTRVSRVSNRSDGRPTFIASRSAFRNSMAPHQTLRRDNRDRAILTERCPLSEAEVSELWFRRTFFQRRGALAARQAHTLGSRLLSLQCNKMIIYSSYVCDSGEGEPVSQIHGDISPDRRFMSIRAEIGSTMATFPTTYVEQLIARYCCYAISA
jgi:hypothetical protein